MVDKVLRYKRVKLDDTVFIINEAASGRDNILHTVEGFVIEPSSKPGFYQLNVLFKGDSQADYTRYFLASMASIIIECDLEDAPVATQLVLPKTPSINLSSPSSPSSPS